MDYTTKYNEKQSNISVNTPTTSLTEIPKRDNAKKQRYPYVFMYEYKLAAKLIIIIINKIYE